MSALTTVDLSPLTYDQTSVLFDDESRFLHESGQPILEAVDMAGHGYQRVVDTFLDLPQPLAKPLSGVDPTELLEEIGYVDIHGALPGTYTVLRISEVNTFAGLKSRDVCFLLITQQCGELVFAYDFHRALAGFVDTYVTPIHGNTQVTQAPMPVQGSELVQPQQLTERRVTDGVIRLYLLDPGQGVIAQASYSLRLEILPFSSNRESTCPRANGMFRAGIDSYQDVVRRIERGPQQIHPYTEMDTDQRWRGLLQAHTHGRTVSVSHDMERNRTFIEVAGSHLKHALTYVTGNVQLQKAGAERTIEKGISPIGTCIHFGHINSPEDYS